MQNNLCKRHRKPLRNRLRINKIFHATVTENCLEIDNLKEYINNVSF